MWRNKSEQWYKDCVGARRKHGVAVMYWGIISWNWRKPFYIWLAESKKKKEQAIREIAELHKGLTLKEKSLKML